MKNKRGFTLVELLVVIVILTMILLVAFPNFYKITETYTNNYDATTRVLLNNAASMYVNNNMDEIEAFFKNNNSGSLCIPIGKLIAYEYLDSDLKDSSGEIPSNRCILVTKTTNQSTGKIEYQYNANTTQTFSGSDYLPPEIYMTSKSSDFQCKQIMKITQAQLDSQSSSTLINKISSFVESKCNIGVRDNDKTHESQIELKATVSMNQEHTRFFVTYNATDASGNRAIPLKIELMIVNGN